MVGILLKLSHGHTISRSRFPGKRYNWTPIHFITHLLHQGHAWQRINPEMTDLEDFWVCWKHPKIWHDQKSMGKLRQHHFWTFLRSGSESEVRISIKILVLKLTNLMTLIVRNCRYILLLIMTCIFECHECEFVQGQLRFTPLRTPKIKHPGGRISLIQIGDWECLYNFYNHPILGKGLMIFWTQRVSIS